MTSWVCVGVFRCVCACVCEGWCASPLQAVLPPSNKVHSAPPHQTTRTPTQKKVYASRIAAVEATVLAEQRPDISHTRELHMLSNDLSGVCVCVCWSMCVRLLCVLGGGCALSV